MSQSSRDVVPGHLVVAPFPPVTKSMTATESVRRANVFIDVEKSIDSNSRVFERDSGLPLAFDLSDRALLMFGTDYVRRKRDET